MITSSLATLAFVASFALPTLQDPQAGDAPRVIPVTYADGTTARVEVLGIDGDRVTLRQHVLGGHMQLKKRLSDLTPISSFRVESEAANAKTFDDHFRLAKRAAELRLCPQAGKEARAAVATLEGKPEAEARTAEVRAWAATTLEAWLDQAVAQGDLDNARHYLKLLSTRLADQRDEEQIAALAAKVDGLSSARSAEKKAKRKAKMAAEAHEALERKLEPIRKRVAKGDDYYKQAVAKSRKMTQSANLAEKAIASYKSAWEATGALQKKHPEDEWLASEATAIGQHVHDNGIAAALHASNMLTVRGDYKGALDWCYKILKYDPNHAETKEMIKTIQIAGAAASSRWGWGWGAGWSQPSSRDR